MEHVMFYRTPILESVIRNSNNDNIYYKV